MQTSEESASEKKKQKKQKKTGHLFPAENADERGERERVKRLLVPAFVHLVKQVKQVNGQTAACSSVCAL
jgi:hypothetical protein